MAFGTKVALEAVREIAFGSITSSYQAVGPALAAHARLVRIVNQTNGQMYISVDGSTNNIRMAAGSFFILDLSANKIRDDGLFLSIGTVFYVKEATTPTAGNLWIEVLHAEGGV